MLRDADTEHTLPHLGVTADSAKDFPACSFEGALGIQSISHAFIHFTQPSELKLLPVQTQPVH